MPHNSKAVHNCSTLKNQTETPVQCAFGLSRQSICGSGACRRIVYWQCGATSTLLSIRVPAERFDELRAQIRKLSLRVESESIDAQDLTQQYVDQEARRRTEREAGRHAHSRKSTSCCWWTTRPVRARCALRKKKADPSCGGGRQAHSPADRAPETALRRRTCDGRERHRRGTAHAVRARLLSWRHEAQGFRQGKGRPSRHRAVPAQGR